MFVSPVSLYFVLIAMDTKQNKWYIYKKLHGHWRGGFWLFFMRLAKSKPVKTQTKGYHAASIRQRGWDFGISH